MNQAPNGESCPQNIKESLRRYVEVGCPTGSFLEAVLENNLREAIGRADYMNLVALPHIVAYCYSEIPNVCWGSPTRVEAWLEHKRKQANATATNETISNG